MRIKKCFIYILMRCSGLSPSNPYHDIKVKSALMIRQSKPHYYPLSTMICCRNIISAKMIQANECTTASTQALSLHIRHSILRLISPGLNSIVGRQEIWLQKVKTYALHQRTRHWGSWLTSKSQIIPTLHFKYTSALFIRLSLHGGFLPMSQWHFPIPKSSS